MAKYKIAYRRTTSTILTIEAKDAEEVDSFIENFEANYGEDDLDREVTELNSEFEEAEIEARLIELSKDYINDTLECISKEEE